MDAKIFRIILEVAGGDAAPDFYAQLLDAKAPKSAAAASTSIAAR
jgi:hypothetical protein